jgi:hypothetical protein
MTGTQIAIIVLIVVIVYYLIINAIEWLVAEKKTDTAIEDSYSYLGTGDPQFDELADLTRGIISESKEGLRTLSTGYKELKEKDEEIARLSLDLQRLTIRKNLLDMATFDNLMEYWPNDELDPYTVGMVLHYIRKNIRRLT